MTATALILLVIAHGAIVLTNGASIAALFYYAPWYVSVPLVTYLVGAMFGKCPLTIAENYLRRRLDLEEIDSFIEHYLWSKTR